MGFPLTGSGEQWQVYNLAADNISFNVLKHELVPEHHLLSEAEAGKVLSQMGMTCDQLPKIRNNDAGIKVLESIHGPISEGRVVKIVRKSETAQEFVAYRLVTKG
jgi:DNA-directed RNA polymerase subunit H